MLAQFLQFLHGGVPEASREFMSGRPVTGNSSERGAPLPADSARRLVYLAAERTLLSWIRAAIGLVVLGFAVDRFGLLLARPGPVAEPGLPGSSWLGLALIACGIATSIVSALHYRHFLVRYQRGDTRPGPGIPLALGLALLLSVVGVAMAIYLYQASARGAAGRADAAAAGATPYARHASGDTE
jgi:putative membrane protein